MKRTLTEVMLEITLKHILRAMIAIGFLGEPFVLEEVSFLILFHIKTLEMVALD